MSKHDKDLQILLFGNDILKKYLPSKPATGYTYVDSPFVWLSDVNKDDLDVEDDVPDFLNKCSKVVATEMNNAIKKEIEFMPPTRPGRMHNDIMADGLYDQEDMSMITSASDKEKYNARTRAFSVIYDLGTGKVILPTLSDCVPSV